MHENDGSHGLPTQDLITRLTRTLRPVRRLWPPSMRLAVFGSLQIVVFVVAGLTLGLRGDLSQKLHSDGFLLELGFIIAVAISSTVMALLAAVPGREPSRWLALGSVLVAVLGLATAFAAAPWLDPMMGHFVATGWPCAARTAVVAAVPWVVLGVTVRRGATLVPGLAGILTGAASFLFATASLRMSCPLDSAAHLVIWHLGPVLVGILASVLIGSLCLSRRPRFRRSGSQ